jgi:CBS domain-containing protein
VHTIDELMTDKVTSVNANDPVGQVRYELRREHIHAAPVVDNAGKLLGVVTSFDLIDDGSPTRYVQSIMTTDVVTVSPHTNVTDAARTMVEHRVHHLVVTQRNVVLGIVSSFDLMRHLAGRVDQLSATPAATVGLRAAVGDTLVVRPKHFGDRERRATIVEVRGEDGSAPFMVRWSDDEHDEPHLTLYIPSNDAYVEHATPR